MPWHLIGQNLRAHKLRTLLTIGSLAVAVFLVCFLRTVVLGLEAGVVGSASNRLIVQSAVSLFVDLPLGYQSKIEGVPGVARVCKQQWFGGYFQDPSNFFAQFAVDGDRLLETFPEMQIVQGSEEAFRASPTQCLIGTGLAAKYGWKLGSRIPIIGTYFTRSDGKPWEFTVAALYESKSANVDNSTLWFHFKYLYESLVSKAAEGPLGVGVYVIRLAGGSDPVKVAGAVDALFDSGPLRVQTTSEAEFQRQFVTMMGSVQTFLGSIGGGVLFAIMLAVLNTMLLSFRQRFHEIGVLKALGFSDAVTFGMLLFESLGICACGGLLGVTASLASASYFARSMSTILPTFAITGATTAMGLGLAISIGVVAGLFPAWQAMRLECIDALRAEV
ncbi:MAG: ABC transporter permease [Candidatus Wallbacteria bacterium]|nr:ABC transporter permease [Candidatus Wallbacteria bacterium]